MTNYSIDIYYKDKEFDSTGNSLKSTIRDDLLIKGIREVAYIDSYVLSLDVDSKLIEDIANKVLIDPVLQYFYINKDCAFKDGWLIEVKYLEGVTDNVAIAAKEALQDYLKRSFFDNEKVVWIRKYFIKGDLKEEDIKKICTGLLANSTIEIFYYKKI